MFAVVYVSMEEEVETKRPCRVLASCEYRASPCCFGLLLDSTISSCVLQMGDLEDFD